MAQNKSLLLSDLIGEFFRTKCRIVRFTNQKKDKSSFGILWRHIRPQVQSKKKYTIWRQEVLGCLIVAMKKGFGGSQEKIFL